MVWPWSDHFSFVTPTHERPHRRNDIETAQPDHNPDGCGRTGLHGMERVIEFLLSVPCMINNPLWVHYTIEGSSNRKLYLIEHL